MKALWLVGAASFDNLVGTRKDAWRDSETQCPGSFQVNHQLEFCRLLNWDITSFCSPQNFVNQLGGAPEHGPNVWSIRYEAATFNVVAIRIDCWQAQLKCHFTDFLSIAEHEGVGGD